MRTATVALIALVAAAFLLAGPSLGHAEEYSLAFIPTQNAPPGAWGVMTISVTDGRSIVRFRAGHLYPHVVYTIWTVYNVLVDSSDPTALGTTTRDDAAAYLQGLSGFTVPSCPANGPTSSSKCPTGWTGVTGFPKEGNGVSPTAPLGAGFTGGMTLDPGMTFVTNGSGEVEASIELDFDLVNEAPVSNKNVIKQCAQNAALVGGPAVSCSVSKSITGAWLRRFIGEYVAANGNFAHTEKLRAHNCANYDARFDPDNPQYNLELANGADARFWQCVDPATVNGPGESGMPRVHRWTFNHFRLANHPDNLTHGFIGGNGDDHWIDMVGRRDELGPPPGSATGTASAANSGTKK